MNLNAVLAVAIIAAAHSSTKRLEVDIRRSSRGIFAGKYHAGVCSISRSDYPLRENGAHRAEHDIDDPLTCIGAKGDGAWRTTVHDARDGRDNFKCLQNTFIIRHIRVEQRLECVADG